MMSKLHYDVLASYLLLCNHKQSCNILVLFILSELQAKVIITKSNILPEELHSFMVTMMHFALFTNTLSFYRFTLTVHEGDLHVCSFSSQWSSMLNMSQNDSWQPSQEGKPLSPILFQHSRLEKVYDVEFYLIQVPTPSLLPIIIWVSFCSFPSVWVLDWLQFFCLCHWLLWIDFDSEEDPLSLFPALLHLNKILLH